MKVLGKEVSWKGRFLEMKVLGKGGFFGKEGSWKGMFMERKVFGNEGSW